MPTTHFTPLPTPDEMRVWDEAASNDFGLPPSLLMENAAQAAFQVLRERVPAVGEASALVLAGPGMNGGDGFAIARRLLDAGAKTLVLHAKPKSQYSGAAGAHLKLAARCGVPLRLLKGLDLLRLEPPFDAPEIIVDALLGTGLTGSASPRYRIWIQAMNHLRRSRGGFILSVDIPSGVSGQSGPPSQEDGTLDLGGFVQADALVTFEAPKLGLHQPALEVMPEPDVRSIAIPRAVKKAHPARMALVHDGILELLDCPTPTMHKGTAGHVLVIGGSSGMTGAPGLAALAALRAGAGLVTVAAPAEIAWRATANHPDLMTLPLPLASWDSAQVDERIMGAIFDEMERFDALILGPGLGRTQGSADAVRTLLKARRPPTVIDADALHHLSQDPDLYEFVSESDILTPHPGEMSRLTDTPTSAIQADRARYAHGLSVRRRCVVVLKGAGTVVAAPEPETSLDLPPGVGGSLFLVPRAEPNLAVGGTGDVLSGVIGALLARETPPLTAALAGVVWHARAGALLATDYPCRGNLASDVANALPRAMGPLA